MVQKRETGQDPNANVFYDVNWGPWLVKRGYLEDGSEITSAVFTVESPAVKDFEVLNAAKARVYVSGVPENSSVNVKCTLTIPPKDVGASPVVDDFTFKLRGNQN